MANEGQKELASRTGGDGGGCEEGVENSRADGTTTDGQDYVYWECQKAKLCQRGREYEREDKNYLLTTSSLYGSGNLSID